MEVVEKDKDIPLGGSGCVHWVGTAMASCY